jgi:tetratricopeptide (TPR) repeat protein
MYDWDWVKVEASIKRATVIDPQNANALTYAGRVATNLGRFDDAIALYKSSLAVDPLLGRTYAGLCLALRWSGDLQQAESTIRKLIELIPNYATAYQQLAVIQFAQGKFDEALESIHNEPDESCRLESLPLIYYKLNRMPESELALKELISKYGDLSAYQVAETYAVRGEIDLAFQWLEHAYKVRDGGLSYSRVDTFLSNLHRDPRWKPFQKKLKL